MCNNKPKETKEQTVTVNGQKYIDYCDIASAGLQSIFESLIALSTNIESCLDHIAPKMNCHDLRSYLKGLSAQIDGITQQASIINCCLAEKYDYESYEDVCKRIDVDYDKERRELIKQQHIRDVVRHAITNAYVDDLKKALEKESVQKKPKKGSSK